MFTDSYRILKMAGGTLVLLGLVLYSGWGMDEHNPSMEDCQREPERFAGRHVYVGAAEVISHGHWTRVMEGHTTLHLRYDPGDRLRAPPGWPPVGSVISAVGEFEPPDRLRCHFYVVHEGYAWKRPLVYVVSAGGLIALILIVWRRYRFVLGIPVFRPRE